jgi:hypothetical protein
VIGFFRPPTSLVTETVEVDGDEASSFPILFAHGLAAI